jgi:hypothetical protein
MSANAATFEAVIKTVDQSSAPMRVITTDLAKMTGAVTTAGHEMAKLDQPHIFIRMKEHVSLVQSRFESLGSSISGVHGRISKLLPALGSLASVTSLAGVFGLVASIAEKRSDSVARQQRLGVDPARLGMLSMAAKAARVPVEDLDAAISKMSSNVFDAAHGKNKDLANLFAHLKIPMTVRGELRDTGELMQDLFDKFQKTPNADVRNKMAKALAGKSGDSLIPMFELTKKELDEIAEASKGLSYRFSEKETDNLKHYNREMMYLQTAVGGVTNAIGAKLDPLLAPIAKKMREFLVVHRSDIADRVEEVVKRIQTNLEQINWDRIARDAQTVWNVIAGAIESVGGFTNAIEIMIAWKVGAWALSFVGGLIKIGREAKAVSLALLGIRDAALAADTSTAFGGLLGRLALMSRYLTGIGTFLAVMWPTSTASPELDETPHPDGTPRGKDDSANLSRQIYEDSLRPHWKWNLTAPPAKLPASPLPAPSIGFELPRTQPVVVVPSGSAMVPRGVPGGQSGAGSRFGWFNSLFPSDADGSGAHNSAPPTSGLAGRGGDKGGLLHIQIDVANLPLGSTVATNGASIPNPVDTNVGYVNPLGSRGY